MTPKAMVHELGRRCRRLRLARNETQTSLAKRSAVSKATIQRFERTGRANTIVLARLAYALGREQDFDKFLNTATSGTVTRIGELEVFSAANARKRARRHHADAR